jgi:hypothetical protein
MPKLYPNSIILRQSSLITANRSPSSAHLLPCLLIIDSRTPALQTLSKGLLLFGRFRNSRFWLYISMLNFRSCSRDFNVAFMQIIW